MVFAFLYISICLFCIHLMESIPTLFVFCKKLLTIFYYQLMMNVK